MKRDEILCACGHHGIKTVTLSEYVDEFEEMCKWIIEFLSKFQGRGIKINRVNLICVAKQLIFFSFFTAVVC